MELWETAAQENQQLRYFMAFDHDNPDSKR